MAITAATRTLVCQRAGNRCEYCHAERVLHIRQRDFADGYHPPQGDRVFEGQR